MENMINYGIDLGTTNSAIAKFVKGEVEVFKDPLNTGRETLPSVVYYKKDKIVVGSRARTYFEKDVKNVFGAFKRKMGTTESFRVGSIDQSKTPIELSAEVLKELKGFVHSGERVDAAVITIPASFDVIQSNATKEAGYLAGFKQVVLLQEPIAASLAYVNKQKERDLEDGQWLVYDLGGGTFDVALIKIKSGEMKVLDHEGDNFLGGADFDNLIVEKIVIPYLNKDFYFSDLENELKSESGKRNSIYYRLLLAAEEAKKELSNRTSSEIEIRDFKDDNDEEIDIVIDIARSEFEGIIKDYIDQTIDMIKKILVRNSLKPSDIQFTLMVGGSTYVPYVRKRVEEILQIPINCNIDPTTAIAIGAAYYAGTKQKNYEDDIKTKNTSVLKVRLAYQKNTKEDEELLAIRVDGNIEGLFYQITREDNGYDSGRKPLKNRISEDLPLLKDSYNFFRLIILDAQNNVIESDAELIGINHGIPSFAGQPLAHDICIERDNDTEIESNNTKLDLLFKKNTLLPQKTTKQYELNKSIIKGGDEKLIINVLEGPENALPEANQTIGYIEIDGKKVSRDIYKGSSFEITIEMSESRDLKVTIYIPTSDQQFTVSFNPSPTHLPVEQLQEEVGVLSKKLDNEIGDAVEREDFETAEELTRIKKRMDLLIIDSNNLTGDNVTDKKFPLDVKKRGLAQDIDNATRHKRISLLKIKYNEEKEWCREIVEENGNDHDHKLFAEIIGREVEFLNSIIPLRIVEAINAITDLGINILWKTPSFLEGQFQKLAERPQSFNDQNQAKALIEAGNLAIQNKNFDRLREINWGLISLLPKSAQQDAKTGKIGF